MLLSFNFLSYALWGHVISTHLCSSSSARPLCSRWGSVWTEASTHRPLELKHKIDWQIYWSRDTTEWNLTVICSDMVTLHVYRYRTIIFIIIIIIHVSLHKQKRDRPYLSWKCLQGHEGQPFLLRSPCFHKTSEFKIKTRKILIWFHKLFWSSWSTIWSDDDAV